jgi:tRNA threonylcarbamoyladenosine biosynthesis protein TsaE
VKNINICFDLKGLDQTKAWAENLAKFLTLGDSLLLFGDLGAGKTTFTQFLINALSLAPEEVVSPTFTLIQSYDTKAGVLNHLDLYRLEHESDLRELGWDEMAQNSITVVEWPDRLGGSLPENRLEINIVFLDKEDHRHITVKPVGTWQKRILQIKKIKDDIT